MGWAKKRVGRDGRLRYSACYRDAEGRTRSAGIFSGKKEAEREARKAEGKIAAGEWVDPADGKLTFEKYVEDWWWPSRQLEVSTRAAYRSYLDKHFIPYFGHRAMATITTTAVESWIAKALKEVCRLRRCVSTTRCSRRSSSAPCATG